ncbi:MAG: hypothetical protein K2X76_15285 [Sphingomonas sp.]|nr:hypothetical protein [Sphingomonas sp.]
MLERIINPMLGLIMPGYTERAAEKREPQPVKVMPGAGRFPELCTLARDVEPEQLDQLPNADRRLVQVKIDGIRALYVDGRIVSREGVPLDCALHCQPALRRLEEAFGRPMMFDGEYVEEEGFVATIAAQRRGEGYGAIYLFDAVPLEDWTAGGGDAPALWRLQELDKRVMASESPFVGMLKFWEMDAQATRAKFAELIREGYEGLVTKDPASPYVRARSDAWRRLKGRFSLYAPIIDVLMKDGRLQAILVRIPDQAKPVCLARGWSAEEAARIEQGFAAGKELKALVRYELTVGSTRAVRGAVFEKLVEAR